MMSQPQTAWKKEREKKKMSEVTSVQQAKHKAQNGVAPHIYARRLNALEALRLLRIARGVVPLCKCV